MNNSQKYTSVSKGGEYTVVGTVRGAGTLKGLIGIVYQNNKGDLFVREPECFNARMNAIQETQPTQEYAPTTDLQAVLDAYEAETNLVPMGAENEALGCSVYNWRKAILREIRALAEAQKIASQVGAAS